MAPGSLRAELRGRADMKTWAAAILLTLVSAGAAHADVLQSAFDAVNGMLKIGGGGLVLYQGSCRKPLDPNDNREFVGSSTVVFIDKSDQAVLIDTGLCNGGNGAGQHLVVIRNGEAKVITNIGIQDMNFLADNMYAEGDSLFLHGSRWLQNDAHCCPSRKATLEYNIKTEEHKLTLEPK
jgi:hypothetical protein